MEIPTNGEKKENRKCKADREDYQEPKDETSTIHILGPEQNEENILAHILIEMLTSTAKMVQVTDEAEKAAQLAYYCAEGAVEQANKSSALSRHAFLNAQDLGERLLKNLNYSSYHEVFQNWEDLPMGYETFQKILHKAETVLSIPKWKENVSRCPSCSKSSSQTDVPYQEKVNRMLGAVVSLYGHRTEEENTDTIPTTTTTIQMRGRSSSHHKQLEALRNEEHMGGTYVTHRRRSPRHSPLSGVDAVSPLVSEDELTNIKSVSRSPSRLSSPKFLNKSYGVSGCRRAPIVTQNIRRT
ncbi:uncharacterized protein LOC115094189 [Rhinatrema bivittatum]|uniref:uncharacterized protein LOC115094189 n=1 Tax=Rhinatrema bivittatum TaxID=194408 RepID=UPI001128408E|nr:uncharacterized protein LOC115094189 [Rhinatrema bivittatum]